MIISKPDVRYGSHAILCLPDVVRRLGAARVLLVCGRRSFEASGAARALPDVQNVAAVRRWSDFSPNPDAADLDRGLEVLEEFQPDLVLGIGGGSAMDMAKLLCAFRGITDLPTLLERIRDGEAITTRTTGLVLAPTTSGSGSEATHFAVVYIGEDKYSVAGPVLRPDVAILDPALTASGSPYQRATSGIDAVAQAIESLWAVAATDRSRRWARHALRLLLPSIEQYVNEPTDSVTRAMAIGSHLAGRAIDISKTTAAHALSYAITKKYGVSHGHAVGMTLSEFIAEHAAAPPEELQSSVTPSRHQQAMVEVLRCLGATDGVDGRNRFATLMERLGLAPLSSYLNGSVDDGVQALARSVNSERLGNNPVAFTEQALIRVMSKAP